MNEPNI